MSKKRFHLSAQKILLLTTISVLSGCSGMQSQFDCKAVGGIQGCANLNEVNEMADHGAFNQSRAQKEPDVHLYQSKRAKRLVDNDQAYPPRHQERVQSAWIAPYTTKDGSYMWASMASVVIQPGYWLSHETASGEEVR